MNPLLAAPLILGLPIGIALLVVSLSASQTAPVGRKVRGWVVTETRLTLLVLASIAWLCYAGGPAYRHFQEHRLTIAAGSQTPESSRLARALQMTTTLHSPRLRVFALEVEDAAGSDGMLEKGVVQLAMSPADLSAGPRARSVAVLAGSPPQILLARYDVDEQVVFALTELLAQFGGEFAPAAAKGNAAAPRAPAASVQRPPANAAAPLHPGAAAFYDWDKTSLFSRYRLVLVGLVLLALWGWQLRRRVLRPQEIQTTRLRPAAERGPWTFSKILLEGAERARAVGTDRPRRPG